MDEKSFLSNLVKQGLLNVTYLIMAFSMCIQGPTLLDLQEIYDTNLETMSLSLAAVSIGAMIGSHSFGHVWTKFHSRRYFLIFVLQLVLSTSVGFLPHMGNVWMFLSLNVIFGALVASMHAEIWHGLNGGPYVHSLHLSNSVGAFLAPVISKHFLSTEIYNSNHQTIVNNSTFDGSRSNSNTAVSLLYPLTGATMFLFSLGFLYLGFTDKKENCTKPKTTTKTTQLPPTINFTMSKKLLLFFIVTFMFTTFAMQCSILTYLPAFAVRCFRKTRIDGANLLTIALVPYAIARAASIFLAMRLNPVQLMICSVISILCGTILLIVAGDRHWVLTQVGFCVTGFGLGSTFASVFNWIQCYVPMTGVVATWMNIGVCLGQNLAMVVGLFLDREPLFLVHFQSGMMAVTLLAFALGLWVGRKVLRENEMERMQEETNSRRNLI